jgi:hypothetical protein
MWLGTGPVAAPKRLSWQEAPMIATNMETAYAITPRADPAWPVRILRRRQLLLRAIAGGMSMLALGKPMASVRAQRQFAAPADTDAIATMMGGVAPVAVPGYQLRLVRHELTPGWSRIWHSISGARVSCVAAGELMIEIQAGAAVTWRTHDVRGAPSAEIAPLDVPIICRTGDCITFDHDTVPTVYAAWNAVHVSVVLWETHLSPIPLSRHWQCG